MARKGEYHMQAMMDQIKLVVVLCRYIQQVSSDFVCGKRTPRSDCVDVLTVLNLRSPHIGWNPFRVTRLKLQKDPYIICEQCRS